MNINIAIYKKIINKNYYQFYNYYNIKNIDFKINLLILLYDEEKQHYLQKKIIKKKINVDSLYDKSKDCSNSNNLFKDIYELIQKYKKLNLNDNVNKIKDEFSENKSFLDLYKKGYRFPIYPNHTKGKNLLYNIRTYLISKNINNNKPIYPN